MGDAEDKVEAVSELGSPRQALLRYIARPALSAFFAHLIAHFARIEHSIWMVLTAAAMALAAEQDTVKVALQHVIGAAAGAVLGMIAVHLASFLPFSTPLDFATGTVFVCIGATALASWRKEFKTSLATGLIILLAHPSHPDPVISGLWRVVDIGGGVLAALIVLGLFGGVQWWRRNDG